MPPKGASSNLGKGAWLYIFYLQKAFQNNAKSLQVLRVAAQPDRKITEEINLIMMYFMNMNIDNDDISAQ